MLALNPDGSLIDVLGDYRRGRVGTLTYIPATQGWTIELQAMTADCPGFRASAAAADIDPQGREAARFSAALRTWLDAIESNEDQRLNRLDNAVQRGTAAVLGRVAAFGDAHPLVHLSEAQLISKLVVAGRARDALRRAEARFQVQDLSKLSRRHEIALGHAFVQALKWAGEPARALPIAQAVVTAAETVLLADDLLRFVAMGELAQVYRDARRYDEAIGIAGRLLEQIALTEHRDGREALNFELMLAGAHMERRSPEALQRLQVIHEKLTTRYGEDDSLAQVAISNLMSEYSLRQDHAQALAIAQRLLAIRSRVLGPHHPRTLFVLRSIAFQQWALGKEADAINTNQGLIAAYDEHWGSTHPETLWTVHNSVVYLQHAKRFEEALALADRVVDTVERQRDWALLAPQTRQASFVRYAPTYKIRAELLTQLRRPEAAYDAIELAKARTLLDTTTARIARGAVLPPSAERTQIEALEGRLEALNLEFARTVADAPKAAKIDLERNRLAAELTAINDKLAARLPRYAQLRGLRRVPWQRLQAVLPPDALFLNYAIDARSVHVAIVSPKTGLATRLVDDSPGLAANLRLLARLLAEPPGRRKALWRERGRFYAEMPEGGDPKETGLDDLVDSLSMAILGPVASELLAHRSVIISADADLAMLPVEVLRLAGEPLIKRMEVSYAPSAAVFVLSQERSAYLRRQPRATALLAIGGVNYGGPRNVGGGKQENEATTLGQLRLRAAERSVAFSPLPASRDEVLRAARHFSNRPVTTLLGDEANKDRLDYLNANGKLAQARLLLISAHGVLDLEQPALSSVVLSPDARGEAHVTAADWMTYQLGSDLVAVTACETALGASINGEGVVGLPFAFLAAGSARSLLTLWRIDDRAALRFSDQFFQRLARGEPPTRALREVKLRMLNSAEFTAPFFWAPFVLSGAADTQ